MSASIYDHFYTASDVTVDMSYHPTGKRINLDAIVSIAYTHNISTVPIYTLGNLEPYFYSKGNSLVQGQLDFAFKSTIYMQAALAFLFDTGTDFQVTNQGVTQSTVTDKTTGETDIKYKATAYVGDAKTKELVLQELSSLSDSEVKDLSNILTLQSQKVPYKSLIHVPAPVDIIITFNNANSNMAGQQSEIKINGVKFVSQSGAVNSQDDTALVERFTFMGKNIY